MKTLKDLKKGETLLTTVRKVKGDKYQIEIREFVANPEATTNVAALLNAGDERFTSVNKTRAAWQSATAEGLLLLGVDVNKLSFVDDIAEVNMLNPSIEGERLHVRLIDSMEAFYEGQQPKQVVDKEGNKTFFTVGGNHIYQTTQIVAGEPKHVIIKSDARVKEVTKTKVSAMSLNA